MGLAWILKKLLFGRAFATERGRIKLFGRMDWTLFPSRALALNLQAIGEKLGEEFVYDLGYQAGKDAAKEMVKYMGLKPRGGWVTQKAVISMLGDWNLVYREPEGVERILSESGYEGIEVWLEQENIFCIGKARNPNQFASG